VASSLLIQNQACDLQQ